jgi:phosphopantothenoylcysteine decarboxylase/phosphopantothenate--cysteine ligase
VAPATANCLGKLAHGIADDLLSTVLLAVECPVLLAPAMNVRMWDHPAVRANVKLLESRGVHFVGPEEGRLACGVTGQGRMAEPETILAAITELLGTSKRK